MMRIKLFGLFIAFALLALVRPRKCLELLEAADRGIAKKPATLTDAQIETIFLANGFTVKEGQSGLKPYVIAAARELLAAQLAQECPLPPTGWRCTRRAGHDGPCAAVAK